MSSDNSKYKRTKVVMLPTEKPSNLFIINKEKLSYSTVGGKMHSGSDIYQPQHLYFLSDDEIKEGDWFIALGANHVDTPEMYKSKTSGKLYGNCKKIITTTDKSLWEHDDSVPFPKTKPLSEPSQGFIKKYCEKGGIDEVMVEYELKNTLFGDDQYEMLKVSSDNTITIKPIKDNWSREEVMEVCSKFQADLYKKFPEVASAIETVKNYHDLPEYWKEWFKKNL